MEGSSATQLLLTARAFRNGSLKPGMLVGIGVWCRILHRQVFIGGYLAKNTSSGEQR